MKKLVLVILVLVVLVFVFLVFVYEVGDIIVCVGLIFVLLNDDLSNVNVDVLGGNVGMGVEVDFNIQFGLNLVYMLDFNWGFEVLVVILFIYDVIFIDIVDNGLGLGDGKLVEVIYLLFIVSVVYFFDINSVFIFYVGVGVNYIIFFDEEFIGVWED